MAAEGDEALAGGHAPEARRAVARGLGWRYLSDATCLIRPRSFYAPLVVSRITIICYMFRHV